ncbi:high-affinity nickel-transporter protein [Haloferax mediterranei ATCC 33500]|uniref:High-affinity nickel-transporter protein n=1 Tax=Haloferax mediterranei (strain ATCC 33500 / DSM 1411 / JCM 8866 / NBRC 14739 / NCIMB 2177 / R-4) TaxID=523841 RepID=I3R8F6_HALMT|nr:sulfite exporter TauE/SafE family protein [Haloferax mediterranei]AFK20516.1 high-affinity nickel-transporter protein [Haloferax mediterranei ATCC 33500]AHZ23875.1 high-affinity nickel-transporter protein [Haloferax mediterranei ATCC 33500]ELZ98299.1 high-affinity nickel-transporter protein [Haloferax mediterranei ATCC 33500]MDX5986728.1 sulfite exporter TauE/SafE family protein [Haloferax mediterranei ATCC 33500]QCQ76052.1 high-affinity nickel-transporter protein [Haloferax mediterranei AT
MALASALVAGGVIGIRHALEADHLAAIATMVEDDNRPGIVGASWGVGHSIPIVVVGLLFVALGVSLPESVTHFFEVVVGAILVVLGVRMLLRAGGVSVPTLRGHDHEGAHRHLSVGGIALGTKHTHIHDESFGIGVLHGFAGSGALVIAMVTAAPGMGQAVAFLGAFSLLTVATMATVSFLWGQSMSIGDTRILHAVAGTIGIIVGGLLVVEQFGVLV